MIEAVWKIILNIETKYPEVKSLWEQLDCDAYLIGGYFRDGLYGKEGRDIDIIFSCSTDELKDAIESNYLLYSQNHFKGFKLLLEKDIDIWSIDNNWAFRTGLVTRKKNTLKSLALGCFYNYDALVLNLRTGEYNIDFFDQFRSTKVLDIVVQKSKYIVDNPSFYANFVRAFYIKEKTECSFSARLQEYLHYIASDKIGYMPEDVLKLLMKMREYKKYDAVSPISFVKECWSVSGEIGEMHFPVEIEKYTQLELGF